MNLGYSNFDYNLWRTELNAVGADSSPSELHGIVCGAICNQLNSGRQLDNHQLLGLFASIGEESSTALADSVQALYQSSKKILETEDASFQLLLAEDDESLDRRTDDLAAWCRGFVSGLSNTGPLNLDELPGDAAEIVGDFMSIARATSGDDPEQDEWALVEIIEYVRVGVQLIFAELRNPDRPGVPDAVG